MFKTVSVYALFLAVSVLDAQITTTTTFRNGSSNYTGTQDLTINNQYGGNGLTRRAELNYVYNITGPGGYTMRPLIRFDRLTLPSGHNVVSADLTLTCVTWEKGADINGYYLVNVWDPAAPETGWLNRSKSLLWKAPGASNVGNDIISGKSFQIANISTGTVSRTVSLDPAIVNQWIVQPATNQGVLLMNSANDVAVKCYSATAANSSYRPILTIVSAAVGGTADTIPPSVGVTAPQANQQVSGVINAAATATDNVGVAGVKFIVDGSPFGPEVTAPPYTLAINTTSLADGNHQIAASARDQAGNIGNSAVITFGVSNAVPVPTSGFFAPPEPSGVVTVKLHPTESLPTGTPILVTFGFPFSRGSITAAGLFTVRVLKNGVEVPAYVSMLTPWRHARDAKVDGKSVRVARIQFYYTFSVKYPQSEQVTIEWGQGPRVLNVSGMLNPRKDWHLVTSGSFRSADNVYEPDVYAVLPATHLAKGILGAMQTVPFPSSIAEPRSDPAVVVAVTNWPGFTKFQTAAKNFFYTIINEDDPRVYVSNECPYKTDSEPWLYDRAAAMYALYFQSGFPKALREAVRHSQFYANNLYTNTVTPLTAAGVFRLKITKPAGYVGGNGVMYSYNENLAYTYWLTGDDQMLPYISWVAEAHANYGSPSRWSPSTATWTERHTAYRVLANTVAYEVTGDPNYMSRMLTCTSDYIWHQDGAGGVLPASRIDGGLYHYGKQHGDGGANDLLASPWMSVLSMNAMVRAYAFTEDSAIATFIRRMGTFLKNASRSDSNHQYSNAGRALYYPDYLMKVDGTISMRSASDAEHASDVGAAVSWSYFFSKLLGTPDSTLKQLGVDLDATHGYGIDYWTRPTAPASGSTAFRVTPWRKYGWEYKSAMSMTWALQ